MTDNVQANNLADIRHYLLSVSERAFQLEAQLSVIQEMAFNAVNEGVADPESVLELIKHLGRMGEGAAQDLANSLNDRAVAIGSM